MATTAIPANCAAVTQTLLSLSGQLSGPMFLRNARMRPIIRLQSKTRGAWQNGMGTSVSAVTFERSFPSLTGDGWTNISVSDGDTANACRPPAETVTFGQTSRSYQPRHYSVNTEDYCIRDIQNGWHFSEFLGNITKALSTISEWVWYRRMTQDYFTNAGHHYTLSASAGVQDHASAYNTSNLATGRLSQNILDGIYADLYREGGDKPGAVDEFNGSPVFTLITSMETADHIVRDNPVIRDNVRWAYMGKGEMSPLVPGLPTRKRNWGGYIHEIDPYPRRFLFNGSAYVEVAPFIASATTKGNKWEQNPAYKTAPFEESIIWHEDVYQDLAVNTVTNPALGWNFNPQNWQGEFTPRNIIDRTCNPDGLIIFLRALFASAAKPLNPVVGYTILHARCGVDMSIGTCYSS